MGRGLSYFNRMKRTRAVLYNALCQMRVLTFAAAAIVVTSLVGCVPVVDQRGNLPEQDTIAKIHPGTTTREEVAKLLGTPSSTGVFDTNSWYYISRKTKQVSFFSPEVLDQQVYVINFDGKGVVSGIDHKSLKDGRDIAMAPGATPAPGRELTFLEQVLGNIGRFNKGGSDTGASNGSAGSDAPSTGGPKPYDPRQ